jgi:hydrogenase maturation protein HypF
MPAWRSVRAAVLAGIERNGVTAAVAARECRKRRRVTLDWVMRAAYRIEGQWRKSGTAPKNPHVLRWHSPCDSAHQIVRTFHLHSDNRVADAALEGRRIRITGTVQGVGFRPWVYRIAQACDMRGRVRNDNSGVTIDAFGTSDALALFLDRLEHDVERPAAARIEALDLETIPYEAATDFTIVQSVSSDAPRVSIPPDLASCPECLSEVHDPANRRHGYPFTNCTNCGPRFTIVRTTPYDRPGTTMAAFAMCAACQREYESVADRRFHAQPNACPACGPRLDIRRPDGRPFRSADAD